MSTERKLSTIFQPNLEIPWYQGINLPSNTITLHRGNSAGTTVSFDQTDLTGQFNNIAVASALFCGQFIHSELETLTRREIGDANYIKLLAHPPSIYYGCLGSYPLRVLRGSIPIRFCLPMLKRIRQLMCDFIQNIHLVLPPPLSANCYKAFMYVIATDGDKSIPMVVHWGDFFQHRYPSANPFLSLAETGYLRSAAGLSRSQPCKNFGSLRRSHATPLIAILTELSNLHYLIPGQSLSLAILPMQSNLCYLTFVPRTDLL
ncbi:hypothetical protein HYDPIDRAFT_168300 [Hydnomerulius pinastri MD-312]|uniref:Uncharacterized protein n=1 Tax=Hydnomerulius pinastri MD-312 TaxID=994086 RepID=A0A0C9WF42_9AGAM|nr:hypothetical protein HYDPIDRAFT_168300 [Hydnomerulius pinastri MD-312]